MNYVYHGLPEHMEGNRLIPLNRMGATHSELRSQYLKKYAGREQILKRTIPLLDCLWNDVVQFLPLHPAKVFKLQKQLGLIDAIPPYKFFEIDLQLLHPDKTVVYFKTDAGEDNLQVKWLQEVDFKSLQHIPVATQDYYQTFVGTGKQPFNYQFVPHILTLDSVDISKSNIITL